MHKLLNSSKKKLGARMCPSSGIPSQRVEKINILIKKRIYLLQKLILIKLHFNFLSQ